MLVSGPAIGTGHVAVRVVMDGNFPTIFLGLDKARCPRPCHGLCLRAAGMGEVCLLARSPQEVSVSTARRTPLQSSLRVWRAISWGMNETNPTSRRMINETLRNSPSGQTL